MYRCGVLGDGIARVVGVANRGCIELINVGDGNAEGLRIGPCPIGGLDGYFVDAVVVGVGVELAIASGYKDQFTRVGVDSKETGIGSTYDRVSYRLSGQVDVGRLDGGNGSGVLGDADRSRSQTSVGLDDRVIVIDRCNGQAESAGRCRTNPSSTDTTKLSLLVSLPL